MRPEPSVRRGPAALVLALLLLVSGCASMPGEGAVTKVDESPRADTASRVRVFGVRPQNGDSPLQVVRGFLEAVTSDEAGYETARLYLTKERRGRWRPEAGITVLAGSPALQPASRRQQDIDDVAQVGLYGQRAALVDGNHVYQARQGEMHATFALAKEKGQWRIDRLPDGLVLSRADFERMYHSVNMYYFAAPTASGEREVLVPDPVYLRQIDPVASAVRSLIDGPTRWLSPAVVSHFPRGSALAGDRPLELKESEGRLRIRLDVPRRVNADDCRRMAVQLLRTVREQTTTKVGSVELALGGRAARSCTLTAEELARYELQGDPSAQPGQYFIDPRGRLVRLDGDEDEAAPVPGPFGEGQVELRHAAVRLDGRGAAGVRGDGRALYLADFEDGTEATEVLTSGAAGERDGLSAPSWDGLGDLWVADRDPDNPRLLVLRGDLTITVNVPDLGRGRIESLRVAADGARIALVVRTGDHTTLQLGRVERGGSEHVPAISVKDLRPVAPQLEDVAAVSWAGQSRLLVVGRESQGVQQMQYVDTDGSVPDIPTLPAISGVTAVAAPPNQNQPLLADSDEGIFRLRPDSNWRQVEPKEGNSPVYPG
ncbi:LpqB family beta-propeller domain-containing protein [Streptomyces capparidis]